MDIAGKFSKVSKNDYRDGVVLIGFCGNLYPQDLKSANLDYIKQFYCMPSDCKCEILSSWPDGIEAEYSAARRNFKNGFLLLTAR